MKQISNGFWLPDSDQFFVNRPNYEQTDYAVCKPYWPDTRIALDVGAHCGFWSQRLCEDFTYVYSFEPVPEHYECLQANTKKYNNIHTFNVACGDHTGELYMQQYFDNTGMSRIVDHETDLSVPVQRLDDLIQLPVDFIKIDAENTEHSVLLGAQQLINTHGPTLFVEILDYRTDTVPRLLAEWGYTLERTFERNYIFSRR